MNIDKILEYQRLDSEIKKLEKQLVSNADAKAMQKFKAFVQEAQQISANSEKEAEKALKEYKNLQKKYSEAYLTLEKLETSKEKELSEEQCAEFIKKINSIASFLSGLEKNILSLADKINKIWAEYESTKKKYNQVRPQQLKHKENLEKLTAEITPQIEELKHKKEEIAKDIDAKVIKKYNAKKQDNIFPVFVPLNDNMCGGCGMELPSAQLEKLKKDGFLECENERCHRIIYYKS